MAQRAKHKYKKRIDNYYGKGKHKYVYDQSSWFRGMGKNKPATVAQRKAQAQKLRDFVWPKMTAEEKQFFEDYAVMNKGRMGPLWPFVADRALRLLDISMTAVAPIGVAKVTGAALRIGGRKLSRVVVKSAMKKALKQVIAKRGLKRRAAQVAKGVSKSVGKGLEADWRVGQFKTTGRLAGQSVARIKKK